MSLESKYHLKYFLGSTCFGKGQYGHFVNETTFLDKYPLLVFEQVLEDGVCKFIPYYNHLNQLITWTGQVQFPVKYSPSPCTLPSANSSLILFGIKEGFLRNKTIILPLKIFKAFVRTYPAKKHLSNII